MWTHCASQLVFCTQSRSLVTVNACHRQHHVEWQSPFLIVRWAFLWVTIPGNRNFCYKFNESLIYHIHKDIFSGQGADIRSQTDGQTSSLCTAILSLHKVGLLVKIRCAALGLAVCFCECNEGQKATLKLVHAPRNLGNQSEFVLTCTTIAT